MIYPKLDEPLAFIEASLPDSVTVDEIAQWTEVRDLLRSYAKRLTTAAGLIDQACAEVVPKVKGATVESDGKQYARTGKATRKAWKTDDLLRVVKDSRRFDPATGEQMSADQLITFVWNLDAPRLTALEELGIDPDEFCTLSWDKAGVKEVAP